MLILGRETNTSPNSNKTVLHSPYHPSSWTKNKGKTFSEILGANQFPAKEPNLAGTDATSNLQIPSPPRIEPLWCLSARACLSARGPRDTRYPRDI
ncbi:hypothetical protein CEXT_452841 [Caerostris extrusa]|uniref:Uncharacterized protein n=1 Tax=Caerostris extrusa TaxID=172846 RepID=A0AAV4V1L5_CAEEX|nr:hypothetical protein CEXT_452841 [Caerostris extrusa]